MKGIILAGGKGSRLYPITLGVSKQLLPLYNKPMIYYPLSLLMQAGIREICLITTPRDRPLFELLLQDGSQWGIEIHYGVQQEPNGIAESFLIAENFLGASPVMLILGDNLFFGSQLPELLKEAALLTEGAHLFGYRVRDPKRYGVAQLGPQGLVGVVEKPSTPPSPWAITGLYAYDACVYSYAQTLSPSERGELEITDINNLYIAQQAARFTKFSRGVAWLDTGTFDSLLQAASFVQTIEERQNCLIASVEEIAYRNNWINEEQLLTLAKALAPSPYGERLAELAREREALLLPT